MKMLCIIWRKFEECTQLRMGKAESRVENLPWARTAEVQYLFQVQFKLLLPKERYCMGKVYANYLLVDEEGYVLEVSFN